MRVWTEFCCMNHQRVVFRVLRIILQSRVWLIQSVISFNGSFHPLLMALAHMTKFHRVALTYSKQHAVQIKQILI